MKDIYIKVKELENNMICPECGNELVERNGKFIVCSNYPKCKYKKNSITKRDQYNVCPVNTRIINHHIYKHTYSPCYTCTEENVVSNINEGCCGRF